jgi:hypothetical protein
MPPQTSNLEFDWNFFICCVAFARNSALYRQPKNGVLDPPTVRTTDQPVDADFPAKAEHFSFELSCILGNRLATFGLLRFSGRTANALAADTSSAIFPWYDKST